MDVVHIFVVVRSSTEQVEIVSDVGQGVTCTGWGNECTVNWNVDPSAES